MATKEKARTLTGADGAYVNVITKVKDKEVVTQFYVARGEELPSNLADGEEERLEALGAFDAETHRERAAAARADRNRMRGANVAPTKARQGKGLTNNPKTPDLTAPPPGTPIAPPMTQAEAEAYGAPGADDEQQGIALEDHDKAELQEMADKLGVEYTSKTTKPQLIEAIQAKQAEGTTTNE